MSWRSFLPAVLLLAGAAIGRELYLETEHLGVWLGLALFVVCALFLLREVLHLASLGLRGRPWRAQVFAPLAMVAGSVLLGFGVLELALMFGGSMPEKWQQRPAEVEGAKRAYFWHGHLHVQNDDDFRRAGPFGPRPEGAARVMVVGDSLTYGQGVAAEDTYSALLERRLSAERPVEVLNLGVQGYQSEDVLRTVERFLPQLSPDLVVYGVCLNDFLPSGVGQTPRGYYFPLPERFKQRMVRQTRAGGFLEQRYDKLLMSLGLRQDFIEDILQDFGAYQQRFAADVAEINRVVVEAGLPPVVAMVLHQAPKVDSRPHEVTRIAERALTEAGMTVVPTAAYFRDHDGSSFRVSQWDGHPNEEGHRIFAEMLAPAILERLPPAPAR